VRAAHCLLPAARSPRDLTRFSHRHQHPCTIQTLTGDGAVLAEGPEAAMRAGRTGSEGGAEVIRRLAGEGRVGGADQVAGMGVTARHHRQAEHVAVQRPRPAVRHAARDARIEHLDGVEIDA
jgi:hypothetical protein